jgi:hypothetical protein
LEALLIEYFIIDGSYSRLDALGALFLSAWHLQMDFASRVSGILQYRGDRRRNDKGSGKAKEFHIHVEEASA